MERSHVRQRLRISLSAIALGVATAGTVWSGLWLAADTDTRPLTGHDLAFAWQAALNWLIVAAYLGLGAWWVRQLTWHPLGKVAGTALFVSCALTHIDLGIRALGHAPLLIEPHMFWIYGAQAVVAWTFVAVAWRHRGFVLESEPTVKARERRLAALRGMEEVREEERRRRARELHDQTLQGLGAARLALSAALSSTDGVQRQMVSRSVEVIDDEMAALRSLIAELRPPPLERGGLQQAIEALGTQLAERYGLEVAISIDLGPEPRQRLPEAVESALYRIAQEALTNSARHSGARRASVAIRREGEEVELAVTDDGRGFEPRATPAGYGLVGIRERATLAGGVATIESLPGRGTTVRVTIPHVEGLAATPGATVQSTNQSLTTSAGLPAGGGSGGR